MLNRVRSESKANDSDQFLKREISDSPTRLPSPESATVQEVIENAEEKLTESVEAVPSVFEPVAEVTKLVSNASVQVSAKVEEAAFIRTKIGTTQRK